MGTDGTFDIPARKFIISGKNPTNFIFLESGTRLPDGHLLRIPLEEVFE